MTWAEAIFFAAILVLLLPVTALCCKLILQKRWEQSHSFIGGGGGGIRNRTRRRTTMTRRRRTIRRHFYNRGQQNTHQNDDSNSLGGDDDDDDDDDHEDDESDNVQSLYDDWEEMRWIFQLAPHLLAHQQFYISSSSTSQRGDDRVNISEQEMNQKRRKFIAERLLSKKMVMVVAKAAEIPKMLQPEKESNTANDDNNLDVHNHDRATMKQQQKQQQNDSSMDSTTINTESSSTSSSIQHSEPQSPLQHNKNVDETTTSNLDTDTDKEEEKTNRPPLSEAGTIHRIQAEVEAEAEQRQTKEGSKEDMDKDKDNKDKIEVKHEEEEEDEEQCCPICLKEYQVDEEICWSPNENCTHTFHRDCIEEWLLRHEECPCCRQNYLNSSQVPPVSLVDNPLSFVVEDTNGWNNTSTISRYYNTGAGPRRAIGTGGRGNYFLDDDFLEMLASIERMYRFSQARFFQQDNTNSPVMAEGVVAAAAEEEEEDNGEERIPSPSVVSNPERSSYVVRGGDDGGGSSNNTYYYDRSTTSNTTTWLQSNLERDIEEANEDFGHHPEEVVPSSYPMVYPQTHTNGALAAAFRGTHREEEEDEENHIVLPLGDETNTLSATGNGQP